MYTLVLAAAALLPSVVLCVYVFKKDKHEKEPIGLLLLLLAAGVLICFPTVSVCEGVDKLITKIFFPFTTEFEGGYYLDGWIFKLYALVDNFIGVALIEEGFKWLALFLITRNNRNFNSLFDGIIYAVFISLGFASFENLLYTFNYGLETALLRMVTAVPGHMFDAVIMGYYYSWYHIRSITRKWEITLSKDGLIPDNIPKEPMAKDFIFSLLMPVLAHGFYDFCCNVNEAWATKAFAAFLTFLYIFCFVRIKKMSRMDTNDKNIVLAILCEKYTAVAQGVTELISIYRERYALGERVPSTITIKNVYMYMKGEAQRGETVS